MDRIKSRSFSESHIHLPRISSNLQGLLLDEPRSPPSPPLSLATPLIVRESCSSFLHRWSLRFSVHLSLIALFETLFFWLFVSKTEDAALIGLVNSYVGGLLRNCAAMNASQRALFLDVVNVFINQTQVQNSGSVAALQRSHFNERLLIHSWAYVGTLVSFTSGLTATAYCRRLPIQWRQLFLENIALILILGIYEYMFFSTVVYPYESISMPELDRLLLNEINGTC